MRVLRAALLPRSWVAGRRTRSILRLGSKGCRKQAESNGRPCGLNPPARLPCIAFAPCPIHCLGPRRFQISSLLLFTIAAADLHCYFHYRKSTPVGRVLAHCYPAFANRVLRPRLRRAWVVVVPHSLRPGTLRRRPRA